MTTTNGSTGSMVVVLGAGGIASNLSGGTTYSNSTAHQAASIMLRDRWLGSALVCVLQMFIRCDLVKMLLYDLAVDIVD